MGVETPQFDVVPDQSTSQNEAIGFSEPTLVAQHEITRSHSTGVNTPCFYSCTQWSADGTSLITESSDRRVSTFVLPTDLLQGSGSPHKLEAQSSVTLPEPAHAIAVAPFFSLGEPASQTFIAGCRNHPIQLHHALSSTQLTKPICTYKLIRQETEEYITPLSLLWQRPGTHFLCGSANRLDYFDVTRYGSDGPILTIPTIPSKRHLLKGGGVGMRGTVSALSASPLDTNGGSIIAAGTWTKWIGLYDLQRTDKGIAHWSIAGADQEEFKVDVGGRGITQTLWSPCGRYLLVNERHASGLLVYDIRGTGKLLSILSGRQSDTQQKLKCDVFQDLSNDASGIEVWAGSQTGLVQMWQNVGLDYGIKSPEAFWRAHDSPVGSSTIHPSGSVIATCSGAWAHANEETLGNLANQASEQGVRTKILDESSIKLWSLA